MIFHLYPYWGKFCHKYLLKCSWLNYIRMTSCPWQLKIIHVPYIARPLYYCNFHGFNLALIKNNVGIISTNADGKGRSWQLRNNWRNLETESSLRCTDSLWSLNLFCAEYKGQSVEIWTGIKLG